MSAPNDAPAPSVRFEHIAYDAESEALRLEAKQLFEAVEALIDKTGAGRPQALALTKLEEAYMWVGKAIRAGQLRRHHPNTYVGDAVLAMQAPL